MTVSRDDVVCAFNLLLGRNPESETAVAAHMGAENMIDLGNRIRSSNEFKSKMLSMQYFRQSKWVATDVLNGFTQWLDLSDRYVSYGCLMSDWEPEETRYFRSIVAPGGVVLDIGANIGWFSLVAAEMMRGKGVIHAFEPRPETSKMLARTIADNGLTELVHLWRFALSDAADILALNWQPGTENPGGSHLSFDEKSDGNSESVSVSVPAVRLDDLLPDIVPTAVKIDVEGAEPRVLAGASKALGRGKPPILSELYPKQLMSVSGCSAVDYVNLMKELGYRCFELVDGATGRELHDFPPDTSRELISVVFQWLS